MNAIVGSLGQPAPGSANVGNLYADLASRTLWLGVDPAVDSTGSVLISDMLSQMDAIADSLQDAKDYTDDQLLLYAKLNSPTFVGNVMAPTASVTDSSDHVATTKFVKNAIAADVSSGLMVGMIIMYSGLLTNIGTGVWADWHLCDGGGGTPDLRDRFVLGAGYKATRDIQPSSRAMTDETPTAGAHTHTITGTALVLSQIPPHGHGAGTLAGVVTGSSGLGGTHAHIITCTSVEDTGSATFRPHLVRAGNSVNAATDTEPNHNHPAGYIVDVNSGKSADAGGSGAVAASHTHTTSNTGSHVHSISGGELRDAIPWMAIAYIMKIS